MNKIKELIPYIIILIVVVMIRSFIITPVKVDGQSMLPTLSGNEVMILNKLANIDRFDIVVLDGDDEDLIKRVVGMPTDTIEITDAKIYINGKKIKDNFGSGVTSDYPKTKLKNNEYFVLGDNRENSRDSRFFGPVKSSNIKGTAKFVLFPFSKFGNVN